MGRNTQGAYKESRYTIYHPNMNKLMRVKGDIIKDSAKKKLGLSRDIKA